MALDIVANVQQAVADLKRLDASMTGVSAAVTKVDTTTKSLTNSYTHLTQKLTSLTAQLSATKNNFTSLTQSVSALQANYTSLSNTVSVLQQRIAGLEAQLAKLTATKTKTTAATNANTAANNANAASYKTLHGAIRGTSGALGSLWMTYGQIAPLVAAFTATGLVINIQKMGSAFEYMATYASAIGGAATSVGEIKKELLGISGVARTPRELAQGMVELTRAGRTTAEALKEIGTVAKFSTVSQMDMAKSTLQLVTLTSAFSSTTKSASGGMLDLATTADIVSSAALGSATTFEAFNTAMKYMIPISQKAGFTLQEAAAAAMVMADKGLAGSIGTTAIRTGLTRMIAPSKRVIAVLTEAGASMEKFADGDQVMNLGEMVLQLEKVRKQLTKEEWFEFAYRGLGLRGEQLQNLMVGMEEYIQHLDRMADAVGFLDRVFEELTKTTQIQFKELQADLERALITAFSGESARKVITSLRDAINDGRFAEMLDTLTTALYHVGEGFGKILPFVFEFGEEVFKIGGTLLVAKAGVVMFNAAMNASPIMKFVGGLVLANSALERMGAKQANAESTSAVAKLFEFFDPAGKFDGAGQRLTELQSLEIAMAKLNEQLIIYRENNNPRADGQVSVVEQDLIKRISALNEAIKGVYSEDNLAQAHKLFEFDPGMMEFEYYVERVGVSLAETRGHAKVGAEGLLSYDDALKNLGASASEVNEIMRLAKVAGFSEEERGIADILERYRQKKEKLSEVIDLMVKYKKLAPEMADAAKQALSEDMIAAMDKVIAKQEEMNNKLTEGQLEKLDNYMETYFAANDRIFKEDMSMADKRKKLQAELAGFIENEDSRTTRGKIANLNKWYAEGQRLLRGHGKDLADLNRVYQEKSNELLLLQMKEKNDLAAISKEFFDKMRLENQDYYNTISLLEYGWAEAVKTSQSELGDFFVEQFGGLEGAWGSLWDSMLRKFANTVAEMAAIWAAQKFGDMLFGEKEGKSSSGKSSDGWVGAAVSAVGDWVSSLWADGGYISRNPSGGKINAGSGIKDDVFLGYTGNTANYGMGGEYIVNKKATAKFLPLLEEINTKNFADGGMTGGSGPVKGYGGGSSILPRLIQALSSTSGQLNTTTGDVYKFNNSMSGVPQTLQEANGHIGDFGTAVTSVSNSVSVSSAKAKEAATATDDATKATEGFSIGMRDVGDAAIDVAGKFTSNIGKMMAVGLGGAVAGAPGALTAAVLYEKYVAPLMEKVTTWFKEKVGLQDAAVNRSLEATMSSVSQSISDFSEAGQNAWDAGIETSTGLATAAQEAFSSMMSASELGLDADIEGVNALTTAAQGAFSDLSTASTSISAAAERAGASLTTSATDTAAAAHETSAAAGMLGEAAGALGSAANGLGSAAGKLGSSGGGGGGYSGPGAGYGSTSHGHDESGDWSKGGLLGSYATGTDYVPQTGPYLLHRGESVNSASSNAEMVALLKELKYIALATAKHTKKSSDSMVRIEYTGIPEYSRGAA